MTNQKSDDDLNQLVAERLGWVRIEAKESWYEDPEVGTYEQSDLWGLAPPEFFETRVPRVAQSVDAAIRTLKLPAEHEWTLGLTPTFGGGTALAVITNEDKQQVGIAAQPANRLARAMTEAWLMMDKENDKDV